MVELLRSKNNITRFQILVEIAAHGSGIQQRGIAENLSITPQAVSDYIGQLTADKLLICSGRSKYQLTNEGVNWALNSLKELDAYVSRSFKAVYDIAISPAIARGAIKKGEHIGLQMENGILYATHDNTAEAHGTAISDASVGEDVGISGVSGLIELKVGKVEILQIPNIQSGGSRNTNIDKLTNKIKGNKYIGSIGLEALAALKRIGCQPDYIYNVSGTAIDASRHGLSTIVICTEDETRTLIAALNEKGVEYKVSNLGL